MFAYTAAKASVNSALRSVAKEISVKEHRVNSILPGWVKSPMMTEASELTDIASFFSKHPLGAGVPRDVAGMVLFLLSEQTRWITGSNIVVDGGYLA